MTAKSLILEPSGDWDEAAKGMAQAMRKAGRAPGLGDHTRGRLDPVRGGH